MGATNIDTEASVRLRRGGHRVTPQRLMIHRLLRERGEHMSAEQVLRSLDSRLPGTSLPTVYATLELFGELGLVRRVEAGLGATLFDPRTDPHQHAVCRECGRVEDLDAKIDTGGLLRAARRAGFAADRADAVVSGRCGACRGEG
jgi:Fe2+ or Zn2+ uptake regulation protein